MAAKTYFKFFPSDYRSGTIGILNLQEEGLYWRCCAYTYDTGNPIPLDDARAATLLNVHINQYRKVMDALVKLGKFIKTNSGWINGRVAKELAALQERGEELSRIAKEREARKKTVREIDAANQSTPGLTHESTPLVTGGVTRGVTTHVVEQLFKQISDLKAEVCDTRARLPDTRYQIEVDLPDGKSSGLAGLLDEVKPPIDEEKIAMDAYVEMAKTEGLPIPRTTLGELRPIIRARIKEAKGLPGFMEAIEIVRKSAFLCGETTDFRISFPWFIKASNFRKIRDGGYGNGKHRTPQLSREETEKIAREKKYLEGLLGGRA